MAFLSFILNIPYSVAGFFVALISLPKQINLNKKPFAIIIKIRKFWWAFGYFRYARAMAIGNIVLLGPNTEDNDLEHELVHVEQYSREPLVHPILYCIELYRNGYRNNKYEVEAYTKAGNVYKGE